MTHKAIFAKTVFISALAVTLATACTAAFAAPAFADTAQSLVIKDFVGTVTITTADDFSVSGEKGKLTETRNGGLIIDGGEIIDSTNCKDVNGNIDIQIGKKRWFKRIGGYKNLDEYPNINITVPPHSHLEIRDSVIFGSGEDFGSVDAHIKSCGALTLGDIAGPLILKVSGSGDFAAGNATQSSIRISGSGDVDLGNLKTTVIKVTGSGGLEAGNIDGSAKVTVQGSGDVELAEITGGLVYEGRGSSDFNAQSVNGRASITAAGSSDVDIDEGKVSVLMISASGSSEIDFGGEADEAIVSASGSSEVYVDDAEGAPQVKTSGSAEVEINGGSYGD